MECPLEIQGVGHGTQKGEFQATIPVALKTEDGSAVMFDYEVPLIGSHHGQGSQKVSNGSGSQ